MRLLMLTGLLSFLLAFPVTNVWADEYEDTIDIFRNAGQSGAYFDNSYGFVVFPTVFKAGVVVGGARGDGQVYVGGQHVGYAIMTQLTVGLQFGGQEFSQIIFFQDQRAFEEFAGGNFEFGAQATAVAITAAASAAATTTGSSAGASGGRNDANTAGWYYKGLATFTVVKGGLMFEVSIGGQKFRYRRR